MIRVSQGITFPHRGNLAGIDPPWKKRNLILLFMILTFFPTPTEPSIPPHSAEPALAGRWADFYQCWFWLHWSPSSLSQVLHTDRVLVLLGPSDLHQSFSSSSSSAELHVPLRLNLTAEAETIPPLCSQSARLLFSHLESPRAAVSAATVWSLCITTCYVLIFTSF